MTKDTIVRIIFLAHMSNTPEGLSAEEKEEQFRLRDEYIKEWRVCVLQTLEYTYVVDDDGTVHKLTPKE